MMRVILFCSGWGKMELAGHAFRSRAVIPGRGGTALIKKEEER